MSLVLQPAYRGAVGSSQVISWPEVNLTNAIITGRKRNVTTQTVASISGTLDVLAATLVRWTYGAGDVAQVGPYEVQLTAVWPDGRIDKTAIMYFAVQAGL
jgi:hypothetical protein